MPRLTRTQKYADLREQLAHDAEQSISTPQLDPYANKLNQMQGQAMPSFGQPVYQQPVQPEPVYQQQVYQQPVQPGQPQYQQPIYQQPVYQQSVYQQPVVEPTPVVAPVQPVVEPAPVQPAQEVKFINPFAEETNETVETPVVEPTPVVQPVQPEPIYQQPVVEPVQAEPVYEQPVVETAPVIEPVQPIVEPTPVVEPVQVEPVYQQPVVEPTPVQNETPTFDTFLSNTQQMQVVKEETVTNVEPIAEFEEIEDNIEVTPEKEAEILSKFGYTNVPQEDTNTLVDQTFTEVNNYNQNGGVQTIDELTNNIVNELRHPEEEHKEEPVIQYEEVKVDDEEFTKTLSMEISKIMNEVEAAKDEEQVSIDKVVEVEKTPSDFINSYFNVDENAINKSLNETANIKPVVEEVKEEPIEIKNINDLEATHDEIMDTIPFTVANEEDEEDEYYDEDEEDASNTVLNVILIVLIVILVAVLALIVFYILKTKGIIG